MARRRIPVTDGVFTKSAKHRRSLQRTGFRVYRTIQDSGLRGATPAELKLKMQITVPNGNAKKQRHRPELDPPWPVVVFAHGGGWVGGAAPNPSPQKLLNQLTIRGIVCVNVNFRTTLRLGDRMRSRKGTAAAKYVESRAFPAAVRDLKAAVRRVRREIDVGVLEVVGNPDRIGVCGTSSGASLMSTVALTDEDRLDTKLLETLGVEDLEGLHEERALDTKPDEDGKNVALDDVSDYSSAVDFVAPIATPHPDLQQQIVIGEAWKSAVEQKRGVFAYTEKNPELVAKASPRSYLVKQELSGLVPVGGNLPEFLFFHAENDPVVSLLGIDSDEDDADALKVLKDYGLENADLGEGFMQLLEIANGRPDGSMLLRLGNVGHVGWKKTKKRRLIARDIADFARDGLAGVTVP
jgi:acetyl esterase/lipase